jgi:tetratricopeptide (TPR) repeat protein
VEWGVFGYGYRVSDNNNNCQVEKEEEEDELDSKLADEMYIRQWREQALSHIALIDDGDDERLFRLADNIQSVQSSSSQIMMKGIHPMSRLCAARGIAYDEISNSHRAIPFLRMALTIDARCIEALDYVVKRRLLEPEEERRWVASLNFGVGVGNAHNNEEEEKTICISWLRDAYLARLRGGLGVTALTPTTSLTLGDNHLSGFNASPVQRDGLPTPSLLSLGSPDFVTGAGRRSSLGDDHSFSRTIDEAFRNLATKHHLGKSSDILSHAAIRAYGSHDLRSALAYCTAIDACDPFCRTAGYVHVATLVGLGLKRRLFELAHRLVDADPKDSLAWFAVGSYYYLCRRYDLAQRHFSRSTRLDPSSAECWIGFGCSFAVCDESDQALASFRAAQNKYAGSHVPLLYMGIEYLRTNHLSLAGHFLTSAQKTDASDPLCCNELGVWSYRRGDIEDAAFWFLKALRLHVEAESSVLTSTDEALGRKGYIMLSSGGMEKLRQPSTESHQSFDPASPHVKLCSDNIQPPLSTVLYATTTPSGRSISASIVGATIDSTLSDTECIERCKDKFWEPTIFNLGQSYRKMNCYAEAIVCFEKCISLNPGSYSAYAAIGFAKHLSGDVDGAIDSYHEALSRKPEDPFSSEMLTRALSEAVSYPRSSVFATINDLDDVQPRRRGIGSSIFADFGEDKKDNINNDFDMSIA